MAINKTVQQIYNSNTSVTPDSNQLLLIVLDNGNYAAITLGTLQTWINSAGVNPYQIYYIGTPSSPPFPEIPAIAYGGPGLGLPTLYWDPIGNVWY
jgi:hypothetical protein